MDLLYFITSQCKLYSIKITLLDKAQHTSLRSYCKRMGRPENTGKAITANQENEYGKLYMLSDAGNSVSKGA